MSMPTISTCPHCSLMVAIPEGLDATALVRCPLCGAEYPLEAAKELLPPKLIPVETSSLLLGHGGGEVNKDSPHLIFAPEENEDSVETTESPLDAEVCDLIAKHKQGTEEEFPSQTKPPALRRRAQRKPKSVPRIFMEIVFGGVAGIIIAYIVLAWIMGSRFDLPAPPRVLKPVLRFVLPDRIWAENQKTHKNP
jgi:hypothetical protein